MGLTGVDSAALFGLIIMVTWEIWIVVGNATSKSMNPRTAAAISYLVAALLTSGFIAVSDASLVVIARGGLLAGMAGLCTGVSLVSMYVGFIHGSTAVVSTPGTMYFVVVIAIGVVALGENLAVTKLTGIASTILGIILATR